MTTCSILCKIRIWSGYPFPRECLPVSSTLNYKLKNEDKKSGTTTRFLGNDHLFSREQPLVPLTLNNNLKDEDQNIERPLIPMGTTTRFLFWNSTMKPTWIRMWNDWLFPWERLIVPLFEGGLFGLAALLTTFFTSFWRIILCWEDLGHIILKLHYVKERFCNMRTP